MNHSKVFCHASCIAIVLFFCGHAPSRAAAEGSVAPTAAHALTAGDLEAFLDGYMPVQLARENIAGAAIAVVKDGKVLLARGIWLCRRRAKDAGFRRHHIVSTGLDLEVVYLDDGDAAG